LEVVAYTAFEVLNQNFTGGVTVDNDGATVLTVDRATSDGTIIDVQKDGTSVGSIGSAYGVISYINLDPRSGGTGVGATNTDSVIPVTGTGVSANGTKDLGISSARWRDLYLSGGVYLGGTGSANHLDDYETGTWTPASTSTAFATAQGRYTKVGRLVYASFYIQVPASINANFFQLSGLPFTNGNTSGGQNQGSMGNTDMGTNAFTFYVAGSGTAILLRNLNNTDWLRYNAYAGKSIWGAVTYTST